MVNLRRGGPGFTAVPPMEKDESPPFAESLGEVNDADPALDEDTANNAEALSIEERYEHERHAAKLKHWKENPHCVGLVEVSWADEAEHGRCLDYHDGSEPSCCNYVSGLVCSKLGAGRVGNMVVLSQKNEWVEEVTEDEETGEETVRRFTRPKYGCIVGPFWPMLMFVTYPLIFGVSGWTLYSAIPGKHPVIVICWASMTVGLIYALAMTGCRDPGILPKYTRPPPQEESSWRWNDQAQSYRPKGAVYDSDCAVVVEEFDHTCPWTGTAIGKRNMPAFSCFVALVFACLIFDILLLTRAL